MKTRYLRNIGAITNEEQARLTVKKALVVGLGGLGGYAVMFLARLGVGELRICDYDVFDESNLNRQLFSSESHLGINKAEVLVSQMQYINSSIKVVSYPCKFSEVTAGEMISGCDVVIDALDNVESRLILEDACSKYRVPLVFGAVSGWEGQVATIMPGRPKLNHLYKGVTENKPSVLPFSAACVSCYQTAEALKILLGKGDLADKLLLIDLKNNETKILPF